jgi:hypothetical protein
VFALSHRNTSVLVFSALPTAGLGINPVSFAPVLINKTFNGNFVEDFTGQRYLPGKMCAPHRRLLKKSAYFLSTAWLLTRKSSDKIHYALRLSKQIF